MHYHFEWDPHKAELNIRNHKIGFHSKCIQRPIDDDHF